MGSYEVIYIQKMNGEAMKLLAENDGVSELEVDTETVRSSAVPLPV